MIPALERIEREYSRALERHLERGEEATLHSAYEIGRRALGEGLGVLDMVAIIHRSLLAACQGIGTRAEVQRTLVGLESFLLESLSPFEMAHRGAREANAALRRQNETLEAETTRIAHALHDAAGQLLACAHLALDRLEGEHATAGARVIEVRSHLDRVEEEIRRFSHELRPTILDDLGLVPALRFLGDGVSHRTGVSVRIDTSAAERLPRPLEIALYRIAQEALTNAARHARASLVQIHLLIEADCVRCAIHDDGVGMADGGASTVPASNGLGLIGIRERIASLGGTLEIESGPTRGTELRVVIPLEGIDAASHLAGR